MIKIEIEQGESITGIGLSVSRWGDVVISFGDLSMLQIVEKLGVNAVLEAIGKDECAQRLGLVDAEDRKS